MPSITFQFRDKNGALLGERVHIESDFVPRAGELLWVGDLPDLQHLLDSRDGFFIVESVVYHLGHGKAVPCVTARKWLKGHRYELLQERGWLVPEEETEITHDEEDPAID